MANVFSRITPEVRSWIYNVSMAVIPLLIALDVLSDDVAGHIALIVAALLGMGSNIVARANVTKPTAPSTLDEDIARG